MKLTQRQFEYCADKFDKIELGYGRQFDRLQFFIFDDTPLVVSDFNASKEVNVENVVATIYKNDHGQVEIEIPDTPIIVAVEAGYGSGKALLVSQILNADKETIERVMKAMEKNDD